MASAPQVPAARASTTTRPVPLTPSVLPVRAQASHGPAPPSAIAPTGNGIARWNAGPRRPSRVSRWDSTPGASSSAWRESLQPSGARTSPSSSSRGSPAARSGPTERTFPAAPIRQSRRGPSRRPSAADVTTTATGAASPGRDRSGLRIATGAGSSTNTHTSPSASTPYTRWPALSAAQKAISPGPREPMRPRPRASTRVADAPNRAPRSPRRVAADSTGRDGPGEGPAPSPIGSIDGPDASGEGR